MKRVNFTHKGVVYSVDDEIQVKQLEAEHLILLQPFHFNTEVIPAGFKFNGASSPNTPLARFIAAKFYRNIKASCVHDYLCSKAKNNEDRAKADYIYFLLKIHVELDQPWKCIIGLWGVRLGAFLGIGSTFK